MEASRQPEQRALTQEEAAALALLLSSAEVRAEVWAAIQGTYLNPDFWRDVAERARATYLDPELWRLVGQQIKLLLDPETWKAVAASANRGYTEAEARRELEELASNLSSDHIPAGGDVAEARVSVSRFDAEFATTAQSPPTLDSSSSLWDWLKALDRPRQLALAAGAAQVLAALGEFSVILAGADVPVTVAAGIHLLLAVVAFLSLTLEELEEKSAE